MLAACAMLQALAPVYAEELAPLLYAKVAPRDEQAMGDVTVLGTLLMQSARKSSSVLREASSAAAASCVMAVPRIAALKIACSHASSPHEA